jgi:hypothetical protein
MKVDMKMLDERDYYVKKKKILMRQFDAAINIGKQILTNQFGESTLKVLIAKFRNDFENLIPQIPYVGGKDNPLTDNLINSTILLPLLRILVEEGLNFNEIGKLAYHLFETFYRFIPPTRVIFADEYIAQQKDYAKNSKLRNYPGNWVFQFVESDDQKFTYGIDYLECGVYKFYKSQYADHLMPIVCMSDYAKAHTYGYGLKCTQTIGNGAPM